ncbi:Milk fat globule-EGF factor 8 protein [Desmophyllum pertusum]|uniref:Milk fat globule-EGF factor 8 protein n=1 Tax=Desmophyllum pertusum TaxID=174260 RepID=A0A9W9YQ80_9CNID|nr:Milk fat globule-EGF factor 8 protein [Desmophyllum pertusum]
MERRLHSIQCIILSLVFLKCLASEKAQRPKLKLQLVVDDSKPLFQGNKTTLHVNLTHDSSSSSAATQVTLQIQASLKAEFGSVTLSPESVYPDAEQQNGIEVYRLELNDELSGQMDVSIDPHGLTEPGRTHIAHVIATLSYSGDQDDYTDPITGRKLEKVIENAYTSFYFYVLDSDCVQPLGMKSGRIKEGQLFSSSFYKETHHSLGHSPHRARLDGPGYWSPVNGNASTDGEQFLQIAFETPIQLKMGKPNSTEHVKTFDAFTSIDGEVWKMEKQILPKVVININNGDTAVPTAYQSLAATRFLRIQPRTWYKESALRVEVYGCILPATPTQEDFPALGVEKQLITDAQMTASSASDPVTTSASSGRLNSNSAWCSATSNEQPLFLQIDMNEIHVITAISSQSRNTNEDSFESVARYKLGYSEDGSSWSIYQQNGVDKEFLGSLVEDIITKHHLVIPVKARYIQFQPIGTISSVCMRVELYGERSTAENTDKPPVYQRSILLDADNRILFLCNKDVTSGKSVCYIRKYVDDESWIAMDRRIVSILGYDKIQDMIYGVARNRKSYVRCDITKCVSITKGSWLMIRDKSTTILATEIAFVPETASAVGVHLYREQEKAWKLKAKWRAKDLNRCYSGPCENGGSCVGNNKNYTCTCTKDWIGRSCETAVVPLRVQVINFSCNETTNKEPGTINSPNYPKKYNNSDRCSWLINSSHRVRLVFKSFSTERGFDSLFVYDGSSASSPKIGKYHGHLQGKVVESSGRSLFVKFKSDSSVNKPGFLIRFEAVSTAPSNSTSPPNQ